MPRAYRPPGDTDPATIASHLPEPLQQPGGVVLSLLETLLGGQDQLPSPIPTGMGTAVWKGATSAEQAAEPELKSLSKTLGDIFNRVFTPTKPGSGLPKRLRFTGTSREGQMQFHNASPGTKIGPARFEASPAQVDELINGGALDVEQPPIRATSQIQSRIREILDAQGKDLKTDAYRRGASKNAKR